MTANLPASALVRIAREHIPNLPIRPESTWVAILNHDCTTYNDIKGLESFVWLKANKNITVRTLQYHYYQRHPLEDLALQVGNVVPDELTTVSKIRELKAPDKQNDNLLVFRALEGDNVTDEDLRRGIDWNAKKRLAGRDEAHGISLDSDDEAEHEPAPLLNGFSDEEEEKEDEEDDEEDGVPEVKPEPELIELSSDDEEDEKVSGDEDKDASRHEDEKTPKDEDDKAAQDEDDKAARDEDDKVSPADNDEKGGPLNGAESVVIPGAASSAKLAVCPKRDRIDSTEPLEPPSKKTRTQFPIIDDTRPALLEETILTVKHEDAPDSGPKTVAVNSLEEFESGGLPAGLLARLGQLDAVLQLKIRSATDLHCETPECRKPMRLKPWTCLGPKGGVLCMTCSRVWLTTHGPAAALPTLDAAFDRESRRKAELDGAGYSQNMDEDAPIKIPHEQWVQQKEGGTGVNQGTEYHNTPFTQSPNTFGDHSGTPLGYAPFYQHNTPQPNSYTQTVQSVAQTAYHAFSNLAAPLWASASSSTFPAPIKIKPARSPSHSPPPNDRSGFSTSPEPEPEDEHKGKRESPILGESPPPTMSYGPWEGAAEPDVPNSDPFYGDPNNPDILASHPDDFDADEDFVEDGGEGLGEQPEEENYEEDEYFDVDMQDAGAKDNSEDEDYDDADMQGDDEGSEYEE